MNGIDIEQSPDISRTDLIAAACIAAVVCASVLLVPTSLVPSLTAAGVPAVGFDASRFILNGLLVPALDDDAVPLRWVDPRPALRCGPGTEVRVDQAPLVTGAAVPAAPFDLEWKAQDCYPFGRAGPRLDGTVKLTVFREEWGFSAMAEPVDLRVTPAGGASTPMPPGAASLLQCGDLVAPDEFAAGAPRSSCR